MQEWLTRVRFTGRLPVSIRGKDEMSEISVSKQFAALIAFSIQVVVGAVAFIAVFLAATAIAAVVHYFEARDLVPTWLSESAKVVEVAIWVIDLIVFGLFILTELIRSCRTFVEDLFRK